MDITNDYVDYADATGAVKRLPVALGLSCQARKAPDQLTPDEINSMVVDLPSAPAGFMWERALCPISDGPWVVDPNQNPPGYTPDSNQQPASTDDQSDEQLRGFFQSNTNVN